MKYEGTVYRPPTELDTILLQVAVGCTHNKCSFCIMFWNKKFHLVDIEEIENDLIEVKENCDYLDRVFLVDRDVFALSTKRLEIIINKIHEYFPECRTISMYASVRNIMDKSDDELKYLKEIGVNDLYVGHESGSESVVKHMNKDHVLKDSYEQMNRLNTMGIRHHALMMPGIGGKGCGIESGKANADLLNLINPGMILFTTLAVFPETKLEQDVLEGRFTPAGEKEIILEQKTTIELLDLPDTYLWANHILNSSPIAGILGRDKEKMIQELETSMENMDEEKFKATFRRDRL